MQYYAADRLSLAVLHGVPCCIHLTAASNRKSIDILARRIGPAAGSVLLTSRCRRQLSAAEKKQTFSACLSAATQQPPAHSCLLATSYPA